MNDRAKISDIFKQSVNVSSDFPETAKIVSFFDELQEIFIIEC